LGQVYPPCRWYGFGINWRVRRCPAPLYAKGRGIRLAALQPYVDNVINNIPPAQMAPIQGEYPGMFPGNNPIPLFTYFGDKTCVAPAPVIPSCIKEVGINMIVQSPSNDQTTGRPRVTSLTGQVIRFNPAQ